MIRTEYPDSIELGRVSRGGVMKIFFNADDPVATQRRIDAAVRAREYLVQKLGGAL